MKSGFFPIFWDIRSKNIIMIGGGRITSRRLAAMADFDCRLTVIAPEISDTIQALVSSGRVAWQRGRFEALPADADMVLICTNDEQLNHEIWLLCKQNNILVNNCSNHEECDFHFPGIVRREELTVAVNAGGSAHRKAAALRRDIAALLEKGEYDG